MIKGMTMLKWRLVHEGHIKALLLFLHLSTVLYTQHSAVPDGLDN